MKEFINILLDIFYVYLVIGIIIQVLFFTRMSFQAKMMSNGNNMFYVFIVLGFVVGWPKVLAQIIKNRE